MKALRIGKRAVAGYDYVVVAVHEGKLIFWDYWWLVRRIAYLSINN